MISITSVLSVKNSGRWLYLPLTILECGLLATAKAARDHIERCAPCDSATQSMVLLSDLSHAAEAAGAGLQDRWTLEYLDKVIVVANEAWVLWEGRTLDVDVKELV